MRDDPKRLLLVGLAMAASFVECICGNADRLEWTGDGPEQRDELVALAAEK